MGDQNTTLDTAAARHLVRRTGFGARPTEVDAFDGLQRGAAADLLLAFKPKGFKPSGATIEKSRAKWIKYMVKSHFPLQEKLTLFWHDHFATGYSKVLNTKLMALQNRTIRLNCKGDLRVLVKAMNKDAAIIEWLDTVRNHKEIPNENYARELQELFTLGVEDLRGHANYSQADIVQIARAFTGWDYDGDNGKVFFDSDDHDTNAEFGGARGPKQIYGQAVAYGNGKLGGFATPQAFDNPEGVTEIDQVTDIIFAHTDTDGANTVARRTTRRLLEFFCHGGWATPTNAQIQIIDDLIQTSSFDTTFNVQALLRAIFTHDVFYETAPAPTGLPTPPKSIKWPVDFVVSTLRLTGVKGKGSDLVLEGGDYVSLRDHLSNMGQDLLDPPSVFGWDWEFSWISSATLLARYRFARDLLMVHSGGGRFRPERLMDLTLTDAGDIVDAVLAALGVADQVSSAERDVLVDYLGGPGATLDLVNDFDARNEKLGGLFALVIESPVYQTH
jgi:uncharacterized protein (DUF1800 family)